MKDIELPEPVPCTHFTDEQISKAMDGSGFTLYGAKRGEPLFTADQLRAAVEADRAQRVPDDAISGALFDFAGFLTMLDVPVRFGSTEEASPMVELLQGFAKKRGLSLDNADVLHWSTKLASTPAPAQQECWCETCDLAQGNPLGRTRMSLCPECGDKRCPRAKHHDNACAQHQDPPQQERKPMTDEERHALFAGLLSETVDTPTEMFRLIVERVERHHGIKE